jgi:hypothetical protein
MSEPIKLPEALRLADALSGVMYSADDVVKAAAELRRLHGEVDALADLSAKGTKLMYECAGLRAEVERLRGELDRRTTLDPAKEMLGWTPKLPSPPPLWGKGCPVCGLGAGGTATGYVCQRGDCPTRVTCGVPK